MRWLCGKVKFGGHALLSLCIQNVLAHAGEILAHIIIVITDH